MRRIAKAPSAGSTQGQVQGPGRFGIAFLCLFALFAFCGISASSALAGETRVPEPFSPLTGDFPGTCCDLTIASPGGVDVDEVSGNVFLNDGDGFPSPRVTDILGAEGGLPVGLVSPFQLTGFCFPPTQNGVAFDNSPTSPNQGTLYVVDCGNKIKKFTRNPLTEEYEPAGELTSTVNFDSFAGAAVDTHGNLFVSAPFEGPGFTGLVVKFDSAGTEVAKFSVQKSLGQASGVAVNADGDLFVGGNGAYVYPADGSGEIDPEVFTQIVPSSVFASGVAVDPATDNLYITLGNRVAQYDATTLAKELEFGAGTLNNALRLAVNSATDRIYVSDNGKDNVAVFGPPVPIPDVTTKAASEVTGTRATLNGVVNPQGVEVTDCEFEYGPTTSYGSTAPCEGAIPTDSSDHAVSADIAGLVPNGATYHFRLIVDSANGEAKGADRTLLTDNTVSTEPATAIEATKATLNGIVRPEGEPLTDCKFEYGTALDYGQSIPCSPSAAAIADDFDNHPVSATPNLAPNTTYHFRLSATNADGTAVGADSAFTTAGPPRILEQRPLNATQSAVTLQAKIDPAGSATTYHFEFGTDTSYGTRIPADHELFAGSGTDPVVVSAVKGGLQESSVYFFRVIAANSSGTTVGPDQRLETLNVNGLPNDRAFEIVSPADKGTSGSVAEFGFVQQLRVQASEDGNAFLYPIQNGTPDSTAGGWTRWRSERTASGWLGAQVSAPSLIEPTKVGGDTLAPPSRVFYTSPDLSCTLVQTHNPLTEDTPSVGVELGVDNLYRRNADGSHDLISNQLPLNPELPILGGVNFFNQIETSDDCSRVYFRSAYEFIEDASGLYEWSEGTLHDAGTLPNGDPGENAVVGGQVDSSGTARRNAVSPDGQRFFFTAIANQGPSKDKQAIFMREDDPSSCEPLPAPCTVEISASETAVASTGARFEAASEDAGRVFFLANYGIADTTSAGPTNGACGPNDTAFPAGPSPIEAKRCDLYVYDVDDEELTDLSATSAAANTIGAAVQGALAVSDDGSHVYFAALGQLVPGKGNTYAENSVGQGSANVYLAHPGGLDYVTTLSRRDLLAGSVFDSSVLMRRNDRWATQTSADGRRLLFEAAGNLTGYETGGGKAAYLYDADTEELTCISCRPDGHPSLQPVDRSLIPRSSSSFAHRPRAISEDGSRVFFSSFDVLAHGAVLGESNVVKGGCGGVRTNVYQWAEGQVTLLATVEASGACGMGEYLDASADGETVFIASKDQLVPQDKDFVPDVYAIRVGGGFPFEAPPIPCDPAADECQGPPSAQPGAPSPASAGFQGPGNPPEGKTRPTSCPKGKVRRRGKCVKRRQRGAKGTKSKQSRAAKTNRGGAK